MVQVSELGYAVTWAEDHVVYSLTRPHKLNALTRATLEGLATCLDEVERRGILTLVIMGEGDKSFCAGTDLVEAAAMPPEELRAKGDFARALLYRLARAPVISLAAVNGLAYGGGLELAMACTFRISAAHARFSLPEIKLGVLPSYGGTQMLPALVGRSRALELSLTGRAISAQEALAMGLINRVASDEVPLLSQTLDFSRCITTYSHESIRAMLRCVAASGASVTPQGLSIEGDEVHNIECSADAQEGVRAFLEKRSPRFNRS